MESHITFCNSFALIPLPTSEAILCYYVACWVTSACLPTQLSHPKLFIFPLTDVFKEC